MCGAVVFGLSGIHDRWEYGSWEVDGKLGLKVHAFQPRRTLT